MAHSRIEILWLKILLGVGLVLLALENPAMVKRARAGDFQCRPTSPDAMGPFYEPNAPMRSSVGEGYLLAGQVKAAVDCLPIGGARIEFWLAGPDGRYDNAHRATVLADETGRYEFESNLPPRYSRRPPHIHIRVTAPGFRTLVTQHYPERGSVQGTFDLILMPAEAQQS